jgi:hypothetical protein
MDAETPSRGKDRMVVDQGFAPENKRMFHQRHFGRARPRGIDPLLVKTFSLDGPGRHLWAHDIILSVWQFDRVVGMCGMMKRPKEG